jgi:hypothetical protein
VQENKKEQQIFPSIWYDLEYFMNKKWRTTNWIGLHYTTISPTVLLTAMNNETCVEQPVLFYGEPVTGRNYGYRKLR